MGDRRHEVAPGGVGLIARRLLGLQVGDHRVGGERQLGQLIAGRGLDLDVALAAADRGEAVADRLDVTQDAVRHQLGAERRPATPAASTIAATRTAW